MHKGNDQLRYKTQIYGFICWALTIREVIERNEYLHDLNTRRKTIAQWLCTAGHIFRIATMIPEVWEETEFHDFLCVFAGMSEALQNDCRIDFAIDTSLVLQMDEG